MLKTLAPTVRLGLLAAIVIPALIFFAMMKGGGEGLLPVFIIGAIVFAVVMAAILSLDSDKARDAKLPNPLHRDNRAER